MKPATAQPEQQTQPPTSEPKLRSVKKIITAMVAMEGAGVRIHRSLGSPLLDMLDPFLLLDEFRSDDPNDYIKGFPDHPHRGFETVTYMLAGVMQHRDSVGNSGDLGPGSVQWMTAGRGIIHSEMPRQENGLMWGFQLWVNLPGKDKMKDPHYQNIDSDQIPEVRQKDGSSIRVIAGKAFDVEGPVKGIAVNPLYLEINLAAGAQIEQAVPEGHNAFVYVFEGEAQFGVNPGNTVKKGELGVFSPGSLIQANASWGSSTRFLLVAGKPIREPVAKYGPFVMNTTAEIEDAISDFQSGKFVS